MKETNMRAKLFGIVALFAAVFFSSASAMADGFFMGVEGKWHSSEPAFGMPAETTLGFQSTLAGKFIRLNYKIEMTLPSGELSLFEGEALYPAKSDTLIKAFWVDNTGNMHPIRAEISHGRLLADWGTPETEVGRTEYKILEDGNLSVTDWVLREGQYEIFNQKTMTPAGKD